MHMYPIEIRPASSNGYFTPAQSNAYYKTRYAREGITVHWWGDGTGAGNHDNIVNYMLSQAQQGIKSVNFVLSDNKISQLVAPDNVAWCSQAGNPTTISVETQPTLTAEGYKKWGWLVNDLEKRYGRTLTLYPHNHWAPTGCPGTIDLNRIRAEANKWKSGAYAAGGVPMIPDADNYYWRYGQKLAERLRGRQLSRDEFRKYIVGRSDLTAIEILSDGEEADSVQDAQNVGMVAVRDNWQAQIQAAAQTKSDMQKTIDQLNETVSKLQADDNADKQKIQDALNQIVELTAKLEAVNKSAVSEPSGPPATKPQSTSLLTKLFLLFLKLKKNK
jgi:predicted RNA-binding Zn ribbon-like protein